jgi:hypothetical protein
MSKDIRNLVLNTCVAPFETMKSVKELVDSQKGFSICLLDRNNQEKKSRGEDYSPMFSIVASGKHNASVIASILGARAIDKRALPYFLAEVVAEHQVAVSITEIAEDQAEALILMGITSKEMAEELDFFENNDLTEEGEKEMREHAIEVCVSCGFERISA